MKRYVKKPVIIEAIQYTGSNGTEIMTFVGRQLQESKPPSAMEYDKDIPNKAYYIIIPTLEGYMKALKGDYIIKGIKGEVYPCKPDVFKSTYNVVEDNNVFLSEGEKRIRTNFNVSSSKSVDIAKQLMAEAINLLSRDQNDIASYYYDSVNTTQFRDLSGDYQREIATAKTKIEEAAMWAVKAFVS